MGYPEFARERFTLVLHGSATEVVVVDGVEVPGSDGRFEIANAGSGFDVELTA
jgi:hypothetical protein